MVQRMIGRLLLLLVCFSVCRCGGQYDKAGYSGNVYSQVKNQFSDPPVTYGVNCWWWWLNGNVNKAAITEDLEAMKSKNFQGAMIFDAGGHDQWGSREVPTGPLYGSDEWNELFVFALDEAERLGLEIGFNIQSGWNLGGPTVTPEYAAKQITHAELRTEGGGHITVKPPMPEIRHGFYRDIAILAFPLREENRTDETVSDLDLKLGYHELGGSAPDTRFLLGNIPRNPGKVEKRSGYIVNRKDIVDVTSLMSDDGTLTWDAPDGTWCILRIGYTCTKAHVSTSTNNWKGLVIDYMSREAFDFYWKDVVEPILEAAGDHVGTTLTFMETDSWECGGMNWTDAFADEFKACRGYDLLTYLPVAAGYVVDDVAASNAFLADFRKTLGDLVANNHYAVFQQYAHRYDMGVQPESAGPHAGPMDGIKNYGFSDIVMSEFWAPSPHRPAPENRFFLKQASSAAHIYGKRIVGAESFTTIGPHWNDELWHDQKPSFDHEICAGLNRVYFHTFTCSPPEMGLPGQEYFAGTHVNSRVTWWDDSGPFIDYMHRIQSVVQNGTFVADVLYYYGDHVPNIFPHKHADPAGVMPGFDYDVCDETVFLRLEVKDGAIMVPGGIAYRVLVLPDHRVLLAAVLEKTEALFRRGAHVIGYKPERMSGLSGGKQAARRFREQADALWGDAAADTGEHSYGDGSVSWGVTAREWLLSKHMPADFSVDGYSGTTDYDYIHYTIDGADVYFVTNQTDRRQQVQCRFRVHGKKPELWDALTGDIRCADAFTQSGGLTAVPLTFEPYGSVMVVFNDPVDTGAQGTAVRNYPEYETVQTVTGAWEVRFDPEWGGPESVTFPDLMDWTKHNDEGIRYYSGKAVYNKVFSLSDEPDAEARYYLSLGSVKDVGIAGVKINGTDKGVVWTYPFRVEIGDDLRRGDNTLEITVTNSWYNRVAGDLLFPGKKQYTQTNVTLKNRYIKEITPEPSGLLGPVVIECAVTE